jgi:phenylacetic acid degradation operon negative regulatory protein
VPKPVVIKRLIDDFRSRRPMRATSLIVTFFGDVVSQHGDTIWLGSLVRAMAPLGVNERLVRTSVFRLVQEGWLESQRVGRRSFYRFSDYGSHEYQRAARRIYALESTVWKGQWQLLLPQGVPEKNREKFRRSLQWQGYRAIAPGTFAKPGDGGRTLKESLEEFDAAEQVVVLDASTSALSNPNTVRKLVHGSWQLDEVAQAYRKFLGDFRPLARWVRKRDEIEPEVAFIARTLLIHDYRRILLHDTPLPSELLPANWPGAEALELTGTVYRQLGEPSIEYILKELEPGEGPMPGVDASFEERFARVGNQK